MKKVKHLLKTHKFFICVLFIITISIAFRIYNLDERVLYGSDSTRDALIAQEALKRYELPLIGSFSSAGPFVFGPLYFWFNMIALIIMPYSFKTPWILMNITGVLTVVVMMLCGYFIGGKRLAVLTGLFTAFSPQFISRSTGLTQHSLVGISSACLLLFFILFWHRKSLKYPFFMGISFGVALSMHYQALNFFLFLPFLLFVPKMKFKKKIIAMTLYIVGFLIPSIPIIYWDSMQEFANTRNVLDYMLIGQYRIYVPNSWTIFVKFLIDYWSNVVGGNKVVSSVIILLVGTVSIAALLKKKIPGELLSLGIIFSILLIVIRYYKGERFDGYMIYIAPFIFIISAWMITVLLDATNKLKNKRFKPVSKILIYLVIFVILVSDLKNASQFILMKNTHNEDIGKAQVVLQKKYPAVDFQIYDYKWKSSEYSYALGAYLNEAGDLDPKGIPVGVVFGNEQVDLGPIIFEQGGWRIISLEHLPKSSLQRPIWNPVNPSDIYNDLITRWTKEQKLTSTFSVEKYILEKLRIY